LLRQKHRRSKEEAQAQRQSIPSYSYLLGLVRIDNDETSYYTLDGTAVVTLQQRICDPIEKQGRCSWIKTPGLPCPTTLCDSKIPWFFRQCGCHAEEREDASERELHLLRKMKKKKRQLCPLVRTAAMSMTSATPSTGSSLFSNNQLDDSLEKLLQDAKRMQEEGEDISEGDIIKAKIRNALSNIATADLIFCVCIFVVVLVGYLLQLHSQGQHCANCIQQ
jgi:hypothetical protein